MLNIYIDITIDRNFDREALSFGIRLRGKGPDSIQPLVAQVPGGASEENVFVEAPGDNALRHLGIPEKPPGREVRSFLLSVISPVARVTDMTAIASADAASRQLHQVITESSSELAIHSVLNSFFRVSQDEEGEGTACVGGYVLCQGATQLRHEVL